MWVKRYTPLISSRPAIIWISQPCEPLATNPLPCPLSHINLAWNNVQLPTPPLSSYLNTDYLFVHGFPSFIQRSSSKQPSAHSLRSSCLTQMPLDPYLRIPRT